MKINNCLREDLVRQLESPCGQNASTLTEDPVTRKASNLMHRIIGGEENPAILEAKWLHSAWTRNLI